MSYKILCSDLDGTLLNSKSEISVENDAAIHAVAEKGVFFVPSTGRTLAEIPQQLREHPAVRYIICSNGAVVLDRQTGWRNLVGISNPVMRKIMDVLAGFEVHITIRHGGNCYVDGAVDQEAVFDYYNVCEAHRVVVRAFSVSKENFMQFAYEADDVEVVSIFFRKIEEKPVCLKTLERLGGLRVTGVDPYNLEIMNVNAGKGNALYSLADALGIDRADTISLGDSDNDASITQAAGLGLATANACASLKEIADGVICSNDEHVVQYVLNHYL